MAILAQEARRSDNEIDAIDATLNSPLGILHIAPDMCKNLGLLKSIRHQSQTHGQAADTNLEAKLADGLAVLVRLGRRDWACQFYIIHSELAEHRRNLDLVLGCEEGVRELFTFSQSA